MINLACDLIINLMEVVSNHNIIVVICLSFIAIKYINKLAYNKCITVADNVSMGVYLLVLFTASL